MEDNSLPTNVDCNSSASWSDLPEPTSERAVRLRSQKLPVRWECEVREALWRLEVVRAVERAGRNGHGARAARLRKIAPGIHWSTFCHWRRKVAIREGQEWERLLDSRVPPPGPRIDPEVRAAAALLRRVDLKMTCADARGHLVSQFGPRGRVSDATLYRIWRAEDLVDPANGDPHRFERVVRYSGGAALALVGAAAAESGVPETMAQAVLKAAKSKANEQPERLSCDSHPGRDERGRFTATYNQAVRQGVEEGDSDSRWDPDALKRERRDLRSLPVLSLAPETLGQRLLTMGMVPLVSSQRGFDGMDTPRAQWLKLLGWRAYRPTTLDKTLADLGALGVDSAMWEAHGKVWSKKAREWAEGGPAWLSIVRYLDVTGDPYWTRKYALSGKVSRTGRVQPCLHRAMLTAGPGVPLLMSTVAGTQGLKTVLLDMLEEEFGSNESAAKKEEPQWITVVDAEGAVPELLAKMTALPRHRFVTVLKGATLKGSTLDECGLWLPFRRRNLVSEAKVTLGSGLVLRGVIMERRGHHPRRTLYVTDALPTELSTENVAAVYLSRWPHQEAIFREARHGAGLEHSQGFSGEYVTHLALEKKQKTAQRRVDRAEKELNTAGCHRFDTEILTMATEDPLLKEVAAEATNQATKKIKAIEKLQKAAIKDKERKDSLPRKIFKRDTTRENIATVMKVAMMLLVEWVLREYFGGLKIELQTFLNYFLDLPIEVRTSWHRVRHLIDVTDLAKDKADWLRKACEEINRREIRRTGRKLLFEVVERLDEDQGQPRK